MKVFRGGAYTPIADPFTTEAAKSYVYYEDGYVAIDGDRIAGVGDFRDVPRDSSTLTQLGGDCLMTPGFFDTHLHAPQLEMIGSYGGHLLGWLNRHTFPTQAKIADPAHARVIAAAVFDEPLRNRTPSAPIFSPPHQE